MDDAATSTWEKLRRTMRKEKPCWPNPQDSTGELYTEFKLKGQFCWEATGAARDTFLILADEIKTFLLRESDPVATPVTWTIYMIGTTRQSSRPTIMFCSSDKSARTTVKEKIKKSKLLEKYPGIYTGDLGGEIRQLTTGRDIDNIHITRAIEDNYVVYSRAETGLGMYVCVEKDNMSTLHKARCGGILYNQNRYFLQTVAHVLTKDSRTEDPQEDSEDGCKFEYKLDGYSDTEDEDIQMTSYGSMSPESIGSYERGMSPSSTSRDIESSNLDRDIITGRLNLQETQPMESLSATSWLRQSLSKLGKVVISSTDSPQNQLDYCLIEIQQSELLYFRLPFAGMNQTLASPKSIARDGPKDVDVTINRLGRPLDGTLSGTPTFMMFPGNLSIQEVWTVRHTGILVDGDCGSWVVDPSGTLYGHVIADSPTQGIVFIIPAYMVFDDLRSRLVGDWQIVRTTEVQLEEIFPIFELSAQPKERQSAEIVLRGQRKDLETNISGALDRRTHSLASTKQTDLQLYPLSPQRHIKHILGRTRTTFTERLHTMGVLTKYVLSLRPKETGTTEVVRQEQTPETHSPGVHNGRTRSLSPTRQIHLQFAPGSRKRNAKHLFSRLTAFLGDGIRSVPYYPSPLSQSERAARTEHMRNILDDLEAGLDGQQ